MDVSQLDERASIVAHATLTFSFSRPTQCRIARMWSAEPGTCGASGESIPRLSRSGEKWSPTSKGKAKYTLSFSGVPTLYMRLVMSSLRTPRNKVSRLDDIGLSSTRRTVTRSQTSWTTAV